MYIWFIFSSFRIVSKWPLFLIAVFFVACGFNKSIGIIGIGTVLAYYWLKHLVLQDICRQKVYKHKESFIQHFKNFHEKKGEEHFNFLYLNAQGIFNTNYTQTVTFLNYTAKAGLILLSFYFLWNSDWLSLILSLIIVISVRLFSSKHLQFHKHVYRTLQSGEDAYQGLFISINQYFTFLNNKIEEENSTKHSSTND